MSLDLSTLVAILTLSIGLYTAYTTRQKSSSDIFETAMKVAGHVIELKDGEISDLEEKIGNLVKYIAYLSEWIKKNCMGPDKPQSFDEYLNNTHSS